MKGIVPKVEKETGKPPSGNLFCRIAQLVRKLFHALLQSTVCRMVVNQCDGTVPTIAG